MPVSYASKDPIQWRVNIIISSRDLARVLEPVVYLEITLESGDKQCIEVPLSKFHMLRQHVALLLKEIDIVREKSSSIVRTVSSQ